MPKARRAEVRADIRAESAPSRGSPEIATLPAAQADLHALNSDVAAREEALRREAAAERERASAELAAVRQEWEAAVAQQRGRMDELAAERDAMAAQFATGQAVDGEMSLRVLLLAEPQ